MVAGPRCAGRVRGQRPRAGRAGRDGRSRRRPGDRQRAVRGDRPPHPPPAPFGASAVTAATDIGMLLVNLGTPDAPEPEAVRRYLAEFLSYRRGVAIQPLLLQPILRGLVLTTHTRQSPNAYHQVSRKHAMSGTSGKERVKIG